MSQHSHENGATPAAEEAQTPPRYAPPAEQQLAFYRGRCSELLTALQDAELTMEFQASLIQSLLTAQAEASDSEPEPAAD